MVLLSCSAYMCNCHHNLPCVPSSGLSTPLSLIPLLLSHLNLGHCEFKVGHHQAWLLWNRKHSQLTLCCNHYWGCQEKQSIVTAIRRSLQEVEWLGKLREKSCLCESEVSCHRFTWLPPPDVRKCGICWIVYNPKAERIKHGLHRSQVRHWTLQCSPGYKRISQQLKSLKVLGLKVSTCYTYLFENQIGSYFVVKQISVIM